MLLFSRVRKLSVPILAVCVVYLALFELTLRIFRPQFYPDLPSVGPEVFVPD